jgi:lipopolysaccharide export system permease protein
MAAPVPRILSGYLLREIALYSAIGLLAVGSVLLTQNLLRQLEDLANLGAHFGDVVQVFVCLLAMLGAYAVPVAFLFGVLVAVGRMSSDAEITAMRALGVSLGQLVVPCLVFGALVSAVTFVLLYDLEPAARRELRSVLSQVAARGGVIEARTFNRLDRKGQRLLFVDDREGARLRGVLISDRTNDEQPFTVVAERGHFQFDHDTAVARIELEDGDVHFEPEEGSSRRYRRIAFARFDYAFDMSKELGAGWERLHPREMTVAEIRGVLHYWDEHGEPPDDVRVKERNRYEIQIHRRLALPLAPLLFALVGLPLGLQRSRGARSYGALLCAGLVFGYYALLSSGAYLAEQNQIPAWFGLWMPNVAFGVVAAVLLSRARHAES